MPAKKVKRSAGAKDVKDTSTKKKPTAAQKNPKGGRRRKLRSLDDIVNMPADVMHEVCKYLHPRDILHLSWASKDFHAFLTRKSSASIWKQSLERVRGLPPRPDKLIEPAWVTFMFTTWCTGCGKTNTGVEAHWNFYARFCKRCTSNNLVQYVSGEYGVTDDEWEICLDVPTDALNRIPRQSAYTPYVFLESDIKEFIADWKKLLDDGADEDAKALFLGKRIIEVRKIAKHASLCSEWVETLAQSRKDELEDLRNERLDEVLSRLRGLGWGSELEFLSKEDYLLLREQKQMRVAKKVTDRVWKNMEGDMVAIMEKVRKQLLAQERQQKLHARWSTFKPVLEDLSEREAAKRSMMGFGDIALLPEVRAIMGAPPDVDVKPSDFDELREQFDEIIGRWSVRLRDELRTVSFGSDTATQGSSKDSGTGVAHASDVEPLELATTRFRCKHCMDRGRETMSYPAVLFHLCAQIRMASWPPKTCDEYEMVAVDMLSRWFSTSRVVRRCWRGVLKSIPPTAMTCKLLELCGKDPRTATVVEMDAEDVKFVLDGKTTMSWRAAMQYQDRHDELCSWQMATPSETTQAERRKLRK